ncbi:MAG: TolC family protein [Bacteroidota bacterium]|nr:TolC family protein [Bacteroidota bacterium]
MKKLLILGLTYLSLNAIQAQSTEENFSLQQAIDYGKKHNPTLLNSKLDADKSKEQVKEILSVGLPQVNGSVQWNDFLKLPASFIPNVFGGKPDEYLKLTFGTTHQITAAINASQLIFDGGYLVGLKASREVAILSQQLVAKSEIDVESNITKAYYAALILTENIKLVNENLTRIEKLLFEMKQMNKNGFVESLDVDKLELTLSNLQIAKANLENSKEIAYKAIKLQMGFDVTKPITLSDNLEKLYTADAGDMANTDFSVQGRIEYKLLREQQVLYTLDKQRYQYGYLPNLVLIGSVQSALNRNNDNLFKSTPQLPWVPSALVGLRLGVPIFDGFQKQSKIAQANIQLRKLQNDSANLSNALNLEYFAAKSKYQNAIKMLDLQKRSRDLSEKIYNTTSIKYKEGIANSFELQTADSDFKTAQTSYLNAIYELLTSKSDLKKAMGK